MALARLAGLADGAVTGRQISVLARADDETSAGGLCASLTRQQLAPAEVVVIVEAPDASSAEIAGRVVSAALGDLADRGATIRAVPAVADCSGARPAVGGPGWIARAANMARSPWVVPWQAGREHDEAYLLDLACARECSQADAVGHANTTYAFTGSLEPELARREFFAAGATHHGLRLFSAGPG